MIRLKGIFLALLGVLCLYAVPIAVAQQSTPTPGMFPLPPGIEPGASSNERLAPPPMPENPTQADLGAQVYYQVCMVCHGDRGQGLTEEWRGVLDPEDQDCWQSGCHHTKHPEGGFIFPKIVPPVVGAGLLAKYPTALQLHDYIRARMPWQARGSRSEAEYWQLTAFLLRLNEVDPGLIPLDADRAANIVLNPVLATAQARPPAYPTFTPSPTPTGSLQRSQWIGMACVFAIPLAGLLVILIAFLKFR